MLTYDNCNPVSGLILKLTYDICDPVPSLSFILDQLSLDRSQRSGFLEVLRCQINVLKSLYNTEKITNIVNPSHYKTMKIKLTKKLLYLYLNLNNSQSLLIFFFQEVGRREGLKWGWINKSIILGKMWN